MAKGLNFTDFGSSNTKLQMKAGAHKRAAGPYTAAAPRWPGPSPSSPGTVRCLLSQHHLPSTSYPPPSSGSASFPPLYSFSPTSHSAFTLAPHSHHVACSCTSMTSWPLALQERRWQAASSPVPSLHRPLGVTSSLVWQPCCHHGPEQAGRPQEATERKWWQLSGASEGCGAIQFVLLLLHQNHRLVTWNTCIYVLIYTPQVWYTMSVYLSNWKTLIYVYSKTWSSPSSSKLSWPKTRATSKAMINQKDMPKLAAVILQLLKYLIFFECYF